MISITSKQHLFRRAGVAHPKGPVEYPDDRFTDQQLKALMAETMLIVEETREEAGSGEPWQGAPGSVTGAGSEDAGSDGSVRSVGLKRKPRRK